MVPPSIFPRLHSLRSLSLGLLRASLSEAVSHCGAWRMGITPPLYLVTEDSYAWRMGINPIPTLGDRGLFRLEDGDKPHPYIVFRRGDKERRHKKLVPPYIISLKTSDLYQLKDVRPLSA